LLPAPASGGCRTPDDLNRGLESGPADPIWRHAGGIFDKYTYFF
jgi:hypothetical protein